MRISDWSSDVCASDLAGQFAELVEEEPLIGVDVLGDDPQHEVGRAHQHIGVEHLGKAADRRAELVEIGATVGVELTMREDMGVEPGLAPLEDSDTSAIREQTGRASGEERGCKCG